VSTPGAPDDQRYNECGSRDVSALPRVSFGIIVFNGEPFTRYCLRALYPYAHEIIVAEGGHEGTAAVATPDGHSTDGTLAAVEAFIAEEDPDGKVKLVTRDGFWPMTDELGRRRTAQSRAYAELATGDYLWQVDIDEFYLPADMTRVLQLLATHPEITQVSFPFLDFWSRPDYKLASSRLLRRNQVHRLFKWGEGYTYVTHEPPIVHDDAGRDLRTLNWVRPETTARIGITMYHYSHLLPSQMEQKAHVYRGEEPRDFGQSLTWLQNSYLTLRRPYRVERHYYWPSWLERYDGPQPPQIRCMMEDIASGLLDVPLRRVDDAERLLASRWYPLGARGLRAVEPLRQLWRFGRPPMMNLLHGRVPKRLRTALRPQANAARTDGGALEASAPRPHGAPSAPSQRVVFLAPELQYPHGMAATNRIELLARALADQGVAPQVWSVLPGERGHSARNVVRTGHSPGGIPFDYLAGSPVKGLTFLRRRVDELQGWMSTPVRLRRLARQGGSVVYLYASAQHWTWSRLALIAAARTARLPIVMELNERPWSLADDRGRLERMVTPLFGVQGAVCISDLLLQWATSETRRTGTPWRLLLIPILVDVTEQRESDYPSGDPSLVFAASADYRETIEFILDAMTHVWERHPGCRLQITGVEPDSRRAGWLGARRRRGDLDSRVELLGHLPRPELLELYAQAHGLLIPLFDDVRSTARFPTKIGEYLASGRPIVSTAVGEMPRYFQDGVTAFMCSPGDPAGYGERIADLLSDPGLAAAVGHAGRELCRQTFDYRIHGPALQTLMATLAAQRAAADSQGRMEGADA
jgi:glycosyltransferase involved in cell wall biosynthesis